MKRTAIVLEKSLPAGQAANVSAILMGHLSSRVADLYSTDAVLDKDGVAHAAVQYSVVLLQANSPVQLANLLESVKQSASQVVCAAFSGVGQSLNNEFARYAAEISSKRSQECGLVGVAVSGEDGAVRALTKKFSLMK